VTATRASNVNIPASLCAAVKARGHAEKKTPGELIIIALEDAGEGIRELVKPRPNIGGTFFSPRPQYRASTTDRDETITPLQFRMLPEDFTALDELVTRFGAKSRTALIIAALTAYLSERPDLTKGVDE